MELNICIHATITKTAIPLDEVPVFLDNPKLVASDQTTPEVVARDCFQTSNKILYN